MVTPEMNKRQAKSGERTPLETMNLSLATARTNEKIIVEGDFLEAWTDGSLDGISLRFNKENADIIYLNQRKRIEGFPFWTIYLTNTAQAGRTLNLLIGREARGIAPSAGAISPHTYRLRSDKDTHFTGSIVQNAKEDENLIGLPANRVRITGIALQSDQQLNYRVIFWTTDGFDNTDLDLDTFCAEVQIPLVTSGFRIAGANQYYLDVRGLEIEYEDDDASQELHVSLMNLSATTKNAGATGEVVLEIYYELKS